MRHGAAGARWWCRAACAEVEGGWFGDELYERSLVLINNEMRTDDSRSIVAWALLTGAFPLREHPGPGTHASASALTGAPCPHPLTNRGTNVRPHTSHARRHTLSATVNSVQRKIK